MSEAMENILTRRSVRAYKPDPVPQEAIEQVVQAGLYAANGMNRQAPVIIAVTDKETRDRLSAANASFFAGDVADPFYGAPAVLVVLARKDIPTHVYDGSCAMQNMMLAAHDLGLGSCWIHRAKEEFETPEWREWLASLGVEGEYEGIGHCILGYVEGDYPQAKPRNAGRAVYVK